MINRIPWPKGFTFGCVCQQYAQRAIRKYGPSVIVFDAYSEKPTIKDATHLIKEHNAPVLPLTSHVKCQSNIKKDEFLNNRVNKQHFYIIPK